MRECLAWINESGKTVLKCGWSHALVRGPDQKEKAGATPPFNYLPLAVDTMCSRLCPPWLPAMMDVLELWGKRAFPVICFCNIFWYSNKKNREHSICCFSLLGRVSEHHFSFSELPKTILCGKEAADSLETPRSAMFGFWSTMCGATHPVSFWRDSKGTRCERVEIVSGQ